MEESQAMHGRHEQYDSSDHGDEGERTTLGSEVSAQRDPSPDAFKAYMKEATRISLLTRDQEVDTAKQIESGMRNIIRVVFRYPSIFLEVLGAAHEHPERTAELQGASGAEDEDGFDALQAFHDLHLDDGKIDRLAERLKDRIDRVTVEKSGSSGRAAKKSMLEDLQRLLEGHAAMKQGRRAFAEANLRLVVSVARRYENLGVPLLDLIQEGNIGLMRAVEKFDYRLGHKFSTYAIWWIRQAIIRGIQSQGETIRKPVHVTERLIKVGRAARRMTGKKGSKPTAREIAEETKLPLRSVEKAIRNLGRRQSISMNTPMGDGTSEFGDLIEDEETISPEEVVAENSMACAVHRVLSTLSPREQYILRKRFGIGDDESYTLEQLAREFGLTRERIRQIETRALNKLRHPARRKCLVGT